MDVPLPEPVNVAFPPDQVRFRSLLAEPYPDGRRVRLKLAVTPFLERPNIEIELRNPQGLELGSAAVVENGEASLSMTVHLREDPQERDYRAVATVVYPQHGTVDSAEVGFSFPRSPADGNTEDAAW